MSLQDQITTKITEAMKARDTFALDTLRMAKTALMNAVIAKNDHLLSDADEIQVLQKEAKKRRDSVTMYRQGGRPELADKEQREADFLEQFLPTQLSDGEIEQAVQKAIAEVGASSAADTGKVMATVMPSLRGQADGAKISEVVRRLLS